MIIPPLAVLWDALCAGRADSELAALCLEAQAALPTELHPALWAHVHGLWVAAREGLPPTDVETRAEDCALWGLRWLRTTPPSPRSRTRLLWQRTGWLPEPHQPGWEWMCSVAVAWYWGWP